MARAFYPALAACYQREAADYAEYARIYLSLVLEMGSTRDAIDSAGSATYYQDQAAARYRLARKMMGIEPVEEVR